MKFSSAFLTGLFLAVIVFSGCSKQPASGEAVAVVNGTPIEKKDFEKELNLRSIQDPSFKITPESMKEQLNLSVNRKLLVEEAVKRKLAEDDRFKTAIRTYWEQTMIRLLMESLTKEFEQTTYASEDEVKNYYSKLSNKVSFQILRGREKAALEAKQAAAAKGEKVDWDETPAGVTFDQLGSAVLEEAFDMPAGESKIYEKDGIFYLVRLSAKEPATAPAFDVVRERIKEKIKLRKQTAAFEDWFKEKKGKADIKMNLETLKTGSTNGLTQAAAAQ